jgi:hypothetical protein
MGTSSGIFSVPTDSKSRLKILVFGEPTVDVVLLCRLKNNFGSVMNFAIAHRFPFHASIPTAATSAAKIKSDNERIANQLLYNGCGGFRHH